MQNNPLRQFFRRAALSVKLPSQGKFYKPGDIDMPENKEIPVFPMTAIDEITSKTPDALFNGSAIVEVIKSCVPNIKNGWNIPMMDMDPILLAIRAATNGNTMDIESVCPKCEEQGEYEINIVTLLNTLSPGDYDSQPQIGDLKFKFRPISYEKMNKINTAQFEIEVALRNLAKLEDSDPIKMQESSAAMKKVTTLSMGLLAESIECITTPTSEVNEHEFILDYLKNCDHKTYDAIRSMIIKLREGTELKPLPVKCVHCSHEFTQKLVLNISDFFG